MFRSVFTYSTLCLMALLLSAPTGAQESTDQMQCANEGDTFSPDLVILTCSRMLKAAVTPENAAIALTNRALAYAKRGELDRAISDYSEAVDLDLGYARGWMNRGVAYAKRAATDLDNAIFDYTNAINLDPDNADAYYNRGNAYADKKEYDKAIADYDMAIKLNPKYADAYNNRGLAYQNKGEHDQSTSDFNKAHELNPNPAKPSNKVYVDVSDDPYGDCDQQQDSERSIRGCTQIINFYGSKYKLYKLPVAYINRGNAYKGKGEYDQAIADFTKAIELDPKVADAYNNRGYAYEKKGETNQALVDYKKASELGNADAKDNLKRLGVTP